MGIYIPSYWFWGSFATSVTVQVCDGELKTELCQIAAFYEHRLQKGNKAIYHLEAFVAKFMAMYMKFMEDTCGGF